jgi:protein TonB
MLLNKIRKDESEQAEGKRGALIEHESQPVERHAYQPDASNRWFGLGGVAIVACLVAAGCLITISIGFVKIAPPAALTVMDLKQPASPPQTPPEEAEAPRPVEKKEKLPDPVQTVPVAPTILPISRVTVPIPVEARLADPAPKEPETAAPKTMPAPPAPQMSSNGPDSWESRVLAQLNKYRRYPRIAMVQRKQGVPWIRFVMDRDGKVLSVRLERSSGSSDLDREALLLPKRADPLPKPSADKPGDALELIVPVEFFLK